MVLFALLMLAVVLMAMMTISLGAKTKERMELQTVADAAAYSNAIATARTYNTASLLNRAAVSHWVAMAGVQSLHAWGTLTSAYMKELGALSYEFQTPNTGAYCEELKRVYRDGDSFDDCPEAWKDAQTRQCAARTIETRDAAYEFWHARYSLYKPQTGNGEDVSGRCTGPICTAPRDRLSPGYGQLDEEVAEQARSIRDAIHNLTALQIDTYNSLEQVLDKQSLAARLLRQSQGMGPGAEVPDPPAGFEVPWTRDGDRKHPAWKEVSSAVTRQRERTHEEALAHSILGSVGLRFPMALEMKNGDIRPPLKVTRFVQEIQGYVNQTHPNKFRFSLNNVGNTGNRIRGCASFSSSSQPSEADMKKCDGKGLGMGSATGIAIGHVTVEYRDGCTGQWRTKDRPVVAGIRSTSTSFEQRNEYSNGSAHIGSVDFGAGGNVGGCHGDHSYHENYWGPNHHLGTYEKDNHRIMPGGLGFVFPVNDTDGAGGLSGQPKLPTLLTRRETRPDPWNLLVRFRFERGDSTPATLDLGGDSVAGDSSRVRAKPLAALAHGLTYYHRRGYWDEPPNLLNPFWHASLVRSNIDATRSEENDRTAENLRNAQLGAAADVYEEFESLGRNGKFAGWQ